VLTAHGKETSDVTDVLLDGFDFDLAAVESTTCAEVLSVQEALQKGYMLYTETKVAGGRENGGYSAFCHLPGIWDMDEDQETLWLQKWTRNEELSAAGTDGKGNDIFYDASS
jgi:hypothetical protein